MILNYNHNFLLLLTWQEALVTVRPNSVVHIEEDIAHDKAPVSLKPAA